LDGPSGPAVGGVPDRDFFVFDASTDALLKTNSGIGTLLYGVAVDGSDRVYVTQTDARNAVNGITFPAGSRQDVNGDGDVNLADLGNRMFTNEVAILDCAVGGTSCSVVSTVDLDGGSPAPATALATPYGVAVSNDNTTVVGTAAHTSRLFTMDSSGAVLARLDVGSIPKGVALRSDATTGAPQTAYVLNSLANTVSVVNVTTPAAPSITTTINVGADPTPSAVRLGAIAFNNAFASNSGSFSCASCHPDGNTDQLLWRIGGECFLAGCVADEDEPRTTMPVRGLRDSVPLHWDGALGDPFGGPDGSTGNSGSVPASCIGTDQHTCFRDLVDASLSGVMCNQTPSCANGPTGLPGLLTNQEREDMASFLARVSYPPARFRTLDDAVSATGLNGFEQFFMDQGGIAANPDTCADSNAGCHEFPLGMGTNSETLQAFEVPTMRGLNDRFLQFSLGVTAPEELLNLNNGTGWKTQGLDEFLVFSNAFPQIFTPVYNAFPGPIFQMVDEA
ncbi:MAG: hypothetical protein L0206_11870, partial [Actinobacteria bacterium]|nr:hypothetical protein [Actinomycetota bacterium]